MAGAGSAAHESGLSADSVALVTGVLGRKGVLETGDEQRVESGVIGRLNRVGMAERLGGREGTGVRIGSGVLDTVEGAADARAGVNSTKGSTGVVNVNVRVRLPEADTIKGQLTALRVYHTAATHHYIQP